MNFLETNNITSNFHSGELVLDRWTILLKHQDHKRSFHVKVACATVEPAFSEMVVRTYPMRCRSNIYSGTYQVQPSRTFASQTGMARVLVKPSAHGVPVLVVFPTDAPITLACSMVAGTCVPALAERGDPRASSRVSPASSEVSTRMPLPSVTAPRHTALAPPLVMDAGAPP